MLAAYVLPQVQMSSAQTAHLKQDKHSKLSHDLSFEPMLL
jgi:hypothetical protein